MPRRSAGRTKSRLQGASLIRIGHPETSAKQLSLSARAVHVLRSDPKPRADHRRAVRWRCDLRQRRRAAGAACARRPRAARRMEAELRARQDHAGEPCAGLDRARPAGGLSHREVGLGAGRGADPCALAVDDLRHHAGQQGARGDASRGRQCRDPRSDRKMGTLHAGRSALGIAATLVYLWAIL